ncbi:hypothetical protein D3C72_2039850 [compost metagenome]
MESRNAHPRFLRQVRDVQGLRVIHVDTAQRLGYPAKTALVGQRCPQRAALFADQHPIADLPHQGGAEDPGIQG